MSLLFLAALLVVSLVGIAVRFSSSDARALEPCVSLSDAAVRFQSAVTRDLRSHRRLHADVTEFARELRSLGATGCPATKRFVRSAEGTLGSLCRDCAAELGRARSAVMSREGDRAL